MKGVCKGTSAEIEFEDEKISIDIKPEGEKESGWTLLPLNPPVVIINCVMYTLFSLTYMYTVLHIQIQRSSVDSYSSERSVVPCQMSIWSEDSRVNRLHYRMNLKGIKSEHNSLIIESPPACTGRYT